MHLITGFKMHEAKPHKRTRRNRLRYRAKRFKNRTANKKEG